MSNRLLVGADVGGTNVKYVVVDEVGRHERVEEPGEDGAFRYQPDLFDRGRADPENEVGVVCRRRVGDDRCSCLDERLIGEAGGLTRSGLHAYVPTPSGEHLDGGGNDGDTTLVIGTFEWYS